MPRKQYVDCVIFGSTWNTLFKNWVALAKAERRLFKLKIIKNNLQITLTEEGLYSLSSLPKQEEVAHKKICHHVTNIMAEQNKNFIF